MRTAEKHRLQMNSQYKGPKARRSLTCSRDREEVSVAPREGHRDKIRE